MIPARTADCTPRHGTSWWARTRLRGKAVYLRRDEKGNRRYQWKRVKGKKRDADREVNRLLEAISGGTLVKPEWITTSEFLKKWLENYAETHAGGRTLERYEYTVNHRLFPALGH